MIILGLTGSVGMGKSTVARMIAVRHIPVFDADAWVHAAIDTGGIAVAAVGREFSDVYVSDQNKIDRARLGHIVFHDTLARKRLEFILHPMVRQAELDFIAQHKNSETPLIVLDIPLLYETGADELCTHIMVVTAPSSVQRARVLSRPGMTPEKLDCILEVQMEDAQKRARADFILDTGISHEETERDLQQILDTLKQAYV